MAAPLRSIGQVLTLVKVDYPDVSISKIRFLESEGLLSPERAPSGYRRYSQADIDRLRYILRVQRDHYLPLKVIREHLAAMDAGQEPPSLDAVEAPPAGASEVGDTSVPRVDARPSDRHLEQASEARGRRTPTTFSRRELLQASGLSEATLLELERQMLVLPRRGTNHFGREALTICVAARKLAMYGMDSRHLRAIRQAAEREAGLVEQAVQPFLRRQSAEASQAASEVTSLVLHAHAAMMHSLLERG